MHWRSKLFYSHASGETTNDPLIGKYCGSDIPPKAQGTKSTLLVIFASDDSYNYKGFTSQYTEIDICKYSKIKF